MYIAYINHIVKIITSSIKFKFIMYIRNLLYPVYPCT